MPLYLRLTVAFCLWNRPGGSALWMFSVHEKQLCGEEWMNTWSTATAGCAVISPGVLCSLHLMSCSFDWTWFVRPECICCYLLSCHSVLVRFLQRTHTNTLTLDCQHGDMPPANRNVTPLCKLSNITVTGFSVCKGRVKIKLGWVRTTTRGNNENCPCLNEQETNLWDWLKTMIYFIWLQWSNCIHVTGAGARSVCRAPSATHTGSCSLSMLHFSFYFTMFQHTGQSVQNY